jgi:hypothetical protein
MQQARGRSVVAVVTAMLVALSACLVVLTGEAASARPRSVRVTVQASATVTVHQAVHRRVHRKARAVAVAVSRSRHKGKPVGHAKRIARARASAAARAKAKATVTLSAKAAARGKNTKQATARARNKAERLARTRAHTRAKAQAHRQAALKARAKASRRAFAKAHHQAFVHAKRKAKRLARLRRIDPRDPETWIRYAPRHVTPPGGARFNNPYAGWNRRRALLAQVIHAIKSSPGYRLVRDPQTHRRLRCPRNPKFYPSSIKIATYSIADGRFAHAIAAAQRRCVSVQVLMNSHLTATTSHSYGRIVRSLGLRSKKRWHHQRSFAHRCSNGCLGTSVLHSKIYLFSHAGHARNTVITGSSNMTKNAIGIQWNDLYTVNNNATMYRQYRAMFNRMVPDHPAKGPYVYRAGPYTSTFYPYRRATRKTDRTLRSLEAIRCKGARGGTGIKGRTVVYIAMHAWFSKRGTWLARKVRNLYDRGCYVRILYSFLSHPNFYRLTRHTGARMEVRRVLFGGPFGLHATKYSHMKMYAVSGRVGHDRSARIVWTGSNNWVTKSLHADEVTLEIRSARAYRTYVRHWRVMKRTRSSPYWAKFQEPEGGGRAP